MARLSANTKFVLNKMSELYLQRRGELNAVFNVCLIRKIICFFFALESKHILRRYKIEKALSLKKNILIVSHRVSFVGIFTYLRCIVYGYHQSSRSFTRITLIL